MKKFFVTAVLLFTLLFTSQTQAQVSLGVNLPGVSLNIGSQPGWGPVGYNYVDYYYLPDVDMYYYVPTHEYIYFNGGRWLSSTMLPPMYGNFDFYNAYKVVLNGVSKPWLNAAMYRTKYASYRGRTGQQKYIYNQPGNKYSNYYKGNDRNQPRPPQNINRPQPPVVQPAPGRPGKPGRPDNRDNHHRR